MVKKYATLIFIVAIVLGVGMQSHIADAFTYVNGEYFSDDDITKLANDTGFSYRGKVEFYRADPELVNADELNEVCPKEDPSTIEWGCYLEDVDKIYILDSQYQDLDDVEAWTAAHEVMHRVFVHEHPSGEVLKEIQSQFNLASNDSVVDIRESINQYPDDQALRLNELHSFFSAVPSNQTNKLIDEYYSRYFSLRDRPYSARVLFESKLDKRSADLDSKKAVLEARSVELSNYKAEWLDKIESYLPSNIYYGDYQRYNQNVDAYNSNLEIYNGMVSSYEGDRLSFNQDVDEYNELLLSFYPSGTALEQL